MMRDIEMIMHMIVLWVRRSRTRERSIVNFDGHLMVMWECMRSDDFMWIFKVIFILEVLKITSLPFPLFYGCFLNLWLLYIYTRIDDVIGDRVPPWEVGW